jgi:choloylglycine hydrolase
MMKRIFWIGLAFIAAAMFHVSHLKACTGIKLIAKDGSLVHGRTLEFGIKLDTSVSVVPRGYEFTGTTVQGPGLSYKAKYGAVGAFIFNIPALMDGINEKGLAVGTFYFPGYAEYGQMTPENQSQALSSIEFPNWIVTQFATVDEVKAALPHVVIAPTVAKEWKGVPTPFHYIVYDKNGKCLVIEPVHGTLIAYENELGVLTNSPTYDWHITNLRNFINLTPFSVKPLDVRGLELAPFGQGSGMVGMPGDFTPPSRFVRASIFSITAIPSNNANEAVFQAFHILNQFDIPVGVARSKENQTIYSDYTAITCVRDPQSLKYYFKTYDDQTMRVVDLNQFDLNATSIKSVSIAKYQQPVVDISSELR